MGDGLHERLRNIGGVNVMHRLQTEIGQREFFTASQSREDFRVEVPGRV
jgi:hypothetical protein